MGLCACITKEVRYIIRCDECMREGSITSTGTRIQAGRDFKVKGWQFVEGFVLCYRCANIS